MKQNGINPQTTPGANQEMTNREIAKEIQLHYYLASSSGHLWELIEKALNEVEKRGMWRAADMMDEKLIPSNLLPREVSLLSNELLKIKQSIETEAEKIGK